MIRGGKCNFSIATLVAAVPKRLVSFKSLNESGFRGNVHMQHSQPMKNRVFFKANVQPSYTCRFYCPPPADITIKVPSMGDSITDGTLQSLNKNVGDWVNIDEPVATIETEKVVQEVRAPESGIIAKFFHKAGDTVLVGKELFVLTTGVEKPAGSAESTSQAKGELKPDTPTKAAPTPASTPVVTPVTTSTPAPAPAPVPAPAPAPASAPASAPVFARPSSDRTETRVAISRMRQKIAANMKESQNTAALLTTFQEADMGNLVDLRNKYKDDFQKKHNVKLGFMSAFVKASAMALLESPVVNAVIDGKDIVYHNYVDIGVAVATPKGLVVPVLRNCEKLSFADIEKAIVAYSNKARNGQITIDDMTGGTFTISNGGIYGSLMGTPILNPGQSAILGIHAINDRPIVVKGSVVVRPMMYLALTYDHRLVDGRDAVTFLRKIKDLIEDPVRFLLE